MSRDVSDKMRNARLDSRTIDLCSNIPSGVSFVTGALSKKKRFSLQKPTPRLASHVWRNARIPLYRKLIFAFVKSISVSCSTEKHPDVDGWRNIAAPHQMNLASGRSSLANSRSPLAIREVALFAEKRSRIFPRERMNAILARAIGKWAPQLLRFFAGKKNSSFWQSRRPWKALRLGLDVWFFAGKRQQREGSNRIAFAKFKDPVFNGRPCCLARSIHRLNKNAGWLNVLYRSRRAFRRAAWDFNLRMVGDVECNVRKVGGNPAGST